MIFTSCYKNCQGGNTIAISSDGGKTENYQGEVISDFGAMHLDIANPSKEEVIQYVKDYYEHLLSKLDITKMYHQVNKYTARTTGNTFQEGSIILDYEGPKAFSNRHIVAAWFELYYNQSIPEIIIGEDLKFTRQPKNLYYPIIKGTLETLMKRDMEMYGYNCIYSAYLYKLSLDAEQKPKIFKRFEMTSESLRREADLYEKKYLEEQKKTNLKGKN